MRGLMVFCISMFLFVGVAFAEEKEAVKAKEVVVTATKTEMELEDVPSSVTIITKEEIEARGAKTLGDIIRFDSSFNLERARGMDFPTIRGMRSRHTLILIDGKRITGEEDRDFELDRITLENVERIEILKGPASALYGTDAMGGVINIITKRPEKFRFEFKPKYGVFEGGDGRQRGLSTYMSFAQPDKFGLSVAGTLLNTDPYFRENQTTMQADSERRTLSLRGDIYLTEATKLMFNASFMTEDAESRSIMRMGPPADRLRRAINDNSRYDLSLGLNHKSTELEYLLRAYISVYEKDFEHRILATNALSEFDSLERKTPVVEGRITKEIFENHLFTFGGEYRQELFKGTRLATGKGTFTETREGVTRTGSKAELNYWAAYIQNEWQVTDNLLIIPAIRYDDSDKFESNISPKIGVTYRILPGLRVKASYGQGFKSPTPRELYIDFRRPGPRYLISGNPNVGSEKSNAYELSLEGERGIFSGKLTYFFNDVKDLIETVEVIPPPAGTPAGWRVFTYRNISKAEIQGIEAMVGANITEKISLRGNYTYLDAKDRTNNQRLTMRPRHKLVTKVAYDNKTLGLRGNIWGEWIGDKLWQAAAPTRPEITKSYALWYLSLSKDLTSNLELHVGIDNVFNKKDNDIPLLGSFYHGGIRIRF